LLLLDEPFSALDAPLRSRLRHEFLELQQELDVTTILVTHDPAEAVLLADDLLLLDAGCVLQSGPVSSVYLRPANETVARLLGAEIIGYGRAVGPDRIDVGEGVQFAVGGPSLEPCMRVGWSVPPERVRFAHDAPYPARILQVGEVRDGQRSIGAGEMLNIQDLKAASEEAIGHPTSNSTVYSLLDRHGWRKLMPRPFHPKRNLASQDAFKKTAFQLL
jgi:ABC-type Fe3+/spermidine/putrescine transport system ATPase subunit